MKIKTKFYYHNDGKYFEKGGTLVLQKRHITKLGKLPLEKEGRSFYYDDTVFNITCEENERRYKVDINRIITEASYNKSQKEYLVRLNWFQKQKLVWMYKRHWLQQPGNVVHLFIFVLIISMAFIGFHFVSHMM